MKIIQKIKDLFVLHKQFPFYPLGHAPLVYWYKKFNKGIDDGAKFEGHSPSDAFTEKQARKYFNQNQ